MTTQAERPAPADSPRVVFLTNLIPPYHKPMLDVLASRYRHFRVLLSTPMERNRPWSAEWSGLDVAVQKTITLNGRWRHPRGFKEPLYIHLPVDTLRQLRAFRADVVISGEMGTRTLLAAAYRRLHPETKLMIWAEVAESTEQGRGAARVLLRKLLHRSADGFLVTGESGARYLRNRLGVPAAKLFRIRYTTELAPFAAVPLYRPEPAAHRLLFVGQLIERKGLLPFLAVLQRWAESHPEREVECTLAGDGPLRRILEQLPLPANLKLSLPGNVPYRDLPAVYREAGILFLPSWADTWGVVVNEALAAGLPVLGSRYAQAVSELVREGENGWTFRPDVSTEVWSAIDRSLNTSGFELHRMRSCARETALALTPESLADAIEGAITACCGQRRGGSTPA